MVLTDMIVRIWAGLINGFFQLLYHQFSFMYDWVAALVSGGKWKRWVIESRQFIRGEPILEIGFGPGHLQQYFLSRGKQIFGLDESRFMCRSAKKRLQKSNPNRRQSGLCRGIAQALPFANNSFSTIVMTFPAHYALDEKTIEESQRVLHPKGKMVILLAVRHGGNSLYKRLIRWLFGITHQNPNTGDIESIWMQRYSDKGFRVEQIWHQFGEDYLWFILAEKRSIPFAKG